jgi:hypothetical protein
MRERKLDAPSGALLLMILILILILILISL